jgi:hypothetical protein
MGLIDRMKYGLRSVIDLYIYNEKGNLIAVLDSLKESYIDTNTVPPILYAKDALLDDSLLEFFNKREDDNRSDYDKFVSKGFEEDKPHKTLVYRQTTKQCRLIAKTEIRESESGQDKMMYYEIPKASVSNYDCFDFNEKNPSEWDLAFKIEAYNEDNDLYKIHIEQNEEDEVRKFFSDTGKVIEEVKSVLDK